MILFGYFVPGIRHVSAYLAGFSAMRFKKFAVYAYSGGIIWSFTFILVGKMLGPDWRIVEQYFHHLGKYVLLAVVAVGLLVWTFYEAMLKRT
jgi:membrane protein DedA with SNARE-associated domain